MSSAAAVGVARGILSATPGRATAVATTVSKKGITNTGSGSPTGGMAIAAVTVGADSGVVMVATVADRPPDMAAAQAAPVVGEVVAVAVADVAAATKRPCPNCLPNRMQEFTNLFFLIS
jgi:hypothetical protein